MVVRLRTSIFGSFNLDTWSTGPALFFFLPFHCLIFQKLILCIRLYVFQSHSYVSGVVTATASVFLPAYLQGCRWFLWLCLLFLLHRTFIFLPGSANADYHWSFRLNGLFSCLRVCWKFYRFPILYPWVNWLWRLGGQQLLRVYLIYPLFFACFIYPRWMEWILDHTEYGLVCFFLPFPFPFLSLTGYISIISIDWIEILGRMNTGLR